MLPVVVLDACVLYPAAQRDIFLWLTACDVIRAHWTNAIHDEWMRNVERDLGVARNVLERVRMLIDRVRSDALISRYRQHERLFPRTDAKDRHVAAAAFAARRRSGASTVTIITWNLKDFEAAELARAGVVAETPDSFLCRVLSSSPEQVITAFTRMRDNLHNPSKTTRECVDTFVAQGLTRFARMLAEKVQ